MSKNQGYRSVASILSTLTLTFCMAAAGFGQTQTGSLQKPSQAPFVELTSTYQADFTPVIANGSHFVSWSKGYLASASVGEVKEPVGLYDKTGAPIFETPFTFDGALKTYVQDAVATNKGTIVLAASATSADGASADMLVEVGKEGIRHVIRVSPFYPIRVCVTDDGTIWAYGKELSDDRTAEPRAHYSMLREYSFEKGELRSALDRFTFQPPKGTPPSGTKGDVYLHCGANKVVLVSGPTTEVIQYDLSSSKLARSLITSLPDGFYITGAALTKSGEVYISTFRPGQNAVTGMSRLHVDSSGGAESIPLTRLPSGGKFFVLLGSDGEDLVYSRGRRSPTLFWSQASGGEVTK